MAVSQPTSPYGSADAFISGSLWAEVGASSFLADFDRSLGREIGKVLNKFRENFRSAALQNPEWTKYADKVAINYVGDEFVFQFNGTPEENEAMSTLEYGGYGPDDSAPNPLLRKTLLSSASEASKVIQLEMF
jgi:hypothetical protein